MWKRRFRALTTVVEVTSECPDIAMSLTALLGTYDQTDAPYHLHYRIAPHGDGRGTWRDGELWHHADHSLDSVPVLELDLYRQAIARTNNAIVFHAAALALEDTAAVFIGPSGAGKTTLARALIERGASYMSEEAVAVFDDGTVAGLARPIHLDTIRPDPIPGYHCYDYFWRDPDSAIVTSHLLHPPPERIAYGSRRLGRLFIIAYSPGGPSKAVLAKSGDAMARMWPCVLTTTPRSLSHLTWLLQSNSVIDMTSTSIDEACILALKHWG